MKEQIKNNFVNSDEDVLNLLVQTVQNAPLDDTQRQSIFCNTKGLVLKKRLTRSHYSKGRQELVMDEDTLDNYIFSHEFGHFLLDSVLDDTLFEKSKKVMKGAQESFTYQYIYDKNYTFDICSRKMKESIEKIECKENQRLIDELHTLFSKDTDMNLLALWLRKTLMYVYKIQVVETSNINHILEEKILTIVNTYSENQIVDYIMQTYGKDVVAKRAYMRINHEEMPNGLTLLSDLFSALFDGKYYNFETPFCHDFIYYEKNERNSLHEQFANFASLMLMDCKEALSIVKYLLGDEYYDFMESLYHNSILSLSNIEQKKLKS